jgi:hypothetical protein
MPPDPINVKMPKRELGKRGLEVAGLGLGSDLRAIDQAAATIKVHGARHPALLRARIGRQSNACPS